MSKSKFIARCVVEARSPISILSGEEDPLYDAPLVRDVNGLPYLPATSIAGSLRARLSDEIAKEYFGVAEFDVAQRSLVEFSDGLVHDSKGRPHDGRVSRTLIQNDTILSILAERAPILRDRVRLNDRGTVDGSGKFDRSAVPAGARFTFELRSENRTAFHDVLGLIKKGMVLGGASRSGQGQFQCIAVGVVELDLSNKNDWQKYCKISSTGIGYDSAIDCTTLNEIDEIGNGWTLSGKIEGPFLIGAMGEKNGKERRVQYQETVIVWLGIGVGAKAKSEKFIVIPGSSFKGALRHRTEFILNNTLDESKVEPIIQDLFGHASTANDGRAGALCFHDIFIAKNDVVHMDDVTHVSLDRFSGGARDSALFTDDMLWQPILKLQIEQLRPILPEGKVAFEAALQQMAQGLCGIGAEWGEGAGIFAQAKVQRIEKAKTDKEQVV